MSSKKIGSAAPRRYRMPTFQNTILTMGDMKTSIQDPNEKTVASREKQNGRARGPVAGKGKQVFEEEKGEQVFEDMSLEEDDLGSGALSSSDDEVQRPSKKRRRSRKGLEKKYECSVCGKAYSRAEHLLRHQLNHNAKKIYYCDQPGCNRDFVRQDLCIRHRDRHLNRLDTGIPAPQVGRKLASMAITSPALSAISPRGSLSPATAKTEDGKHTQHGHFNLPHESTANPFSRATTETTDANGTPTVAWFSRSNGGHNVPPPHEPPSRSARPMPGQNLRRNERPENFPPPPSNGTFSNPRTGAGQYGLDGMQSLAQASPFIGSSHLSAVAAVPHNVPHHNVENNVSQSFESTQYILGNVSVPQHQGLDLLYTYPPSSQPGPMDFQNEPSWSNQIYGNEYYGDLVNAGSMPFLAGGGVGEGYGRSPIALVDNLVSFLFVTGDGGSAVQSLSTYSDIPHQFLQPQCYTDCGNIPQYTMAVGTVLQQTLPDKRISDEKAEKVFRDINERFNEREEGAMAPMKRQLLDGDRSQEDHLLSTKNMQIYIEYYFDQVALQLPILHQPTFTADSTPNLLLISIMAIGAACLDKSHEYEHSKAAASLSNFLAWYLRWELFSHRDFLPPGKLWMFQTLLLLELYEKMYSNRVLHERGHIHHSTTITLMRRGKSMTNQIIDTLRQSPAPKDERRRSPQGEKEWWNDFIVAESTHRAAYAALLIDSTHAVMFGHSSTMFVNELALPLPCDDKIWTATTSAEAWRLHTNLKANASSGSNSFLLALQRIIHNQEVETNAFGRTVIMAGLLNILWHMKLKERQLSGLLKSLNLNHPRFMWKGMLQDAFDNWSSQYDCSHMFQRPYHHKDELVSESRTVLHHLAHMAMHVDVVECQMFAHAKKLLGRNIHPLDRVEVVKRWRYKDHKTSEMRDAVYHALQLLKSVFMPDARMKQSHAYKNEDNPYSARDDPLMNRPWVIYYAALLVFSYGYAKEGPSKAPIPAEDRPAEQLKAMREYLTKFCDSHPQRRGDPHYLATMTGVSGNSGLLMVVRTCFNDCRWELLQEAQKLLSNCIAVNAGLLIEEGVEKK